MKYLIAIEPGDATHAFGVVVPDLPGCFSAGDTLEDAIQNAREAIELWLETTIEDGGEVPSPLPASQHR
ncbi:MAG TPA: type II toxin-antitoxin system HicB family antitoxin, partial [Duganella sp.]|uniref:type II toxin-antitoxin system HicB family antitoxin n=1 Tax=Duganella sp. TaxID=1904440 RepID=UPI002ED3D9DE